MRILLRNIESGVYFKGRGAWSRSRIEALDFGEQDRALRVAQELKLKNMELVMVSEDEEVFLSIRLPDE
jgi:hypothetical protein